MPGLPSPARFVHRMRDLFGAQWPGAGKTVRPASAGVVFTAEVSTMDAQERARRLALLEDGEEDLEEVDLAPPRPAGSAVVSVRLPAQVADSLTQQAEREDKSTGTLARELIEDGLARRPEASTELLASVFSRLAARMERAGLLTRETPSGQRPVADRAR